MPDNGLLGKYYRAFSGSSVKRIDTFRIALTKEPELCFKQIDSQDCLGSLFYSSSDTENLFMLIL